jgi:hypothetical protein
MRPRLLRLFLSSQRIFTVMPLIAWMMFSLSGCSSEPPEPPGETVVLSPSDYSTSGKEAYRECDTWDMKGLRLVDHDNQKALYCLHQAISAWFRAQALEKAKKDGDEVLKTKAPTDIYIQLSGLYLKMREPTWALKYADLFIKEVPVFNYTALQYRSLALYMLSRHKEALEECQLGNDKGLCSILEGGVIMHQGDPEKGKAMIREAWTQMQSIWGPSDPDGAERYVRFLPSDILDVIQGKNDTSKN